MRHGRALSLAVAALLPLAGGCGGNAVDGGDPADDGGGGNAMEVTVTTDADSYEAGEAVRMTLTARNTSGSPVTLEFTSGQRYDFQILDETGESVWTWSAARGFIQVLGSESVPAGGELSWSETADVDLEPGRYTVRGTVTNRSGGLGDETQITVR